MTAEQLILFFSLASGFLILDKFAFGQFGLSSPIILAPLLGFLFGEPAAGLRIGILFQLLFLVNYPLGGKDLPDKEIGALSAISSFIILKRMSGGVGVTQLAIACLFALLATVFGRETEKVLKRVNKDIPHLFGLLTSFGRGFITTLPFLILAYFTNSLIDDRRGLFAVWTFVPLHQRLVQFFIPLGLGCAFSPLFSHYLLKSTANRWQAFGLFLLGGLLAAILCFLRR